MNNKRNTVRFIRCTAVLLIAMFMMSGIFVSAESLDTSSAESYYFWQNSNGKKAVSDRAIFEVSKTIDGKSLNISSLSEITDMCTADDGRIYLLDAGNNRIIVLKSNYTLERIIDKFVLDGKEQKLNSPQGIFVESNGTIIIADTENMRLIFCNSNGVINSIISSPEGDLIPDDFKFYPIRCVRDKKGFLYILSRGSYYGALTYDENGEFCGFYGSNPVTTDAIEQIERIINRVFTNNASAAYKVQKLPYQFSDLFVGKDDILYTVSPNTSSMQGQIRKLSPSGSNILYQTSGSSATNADTVNFGEDKMYTTNLDNPITQNFFGIAVDDNGYMYALDTSYGKIYVYNNECSSITVVGGGLKLGKQKGTFVTPSSIEVSGKDILVADSDKNSITVFSRTQYGELVFAGDMLSQQGEYESAEYYWKQVLDCGGNYQLAYKGMAQVAFVRGDYDKAMEYALRGDDQATYSQVFEQVSNQFMSKNLWWIIILSFLLLGVIITFIIIVSKKKLVIIKNRKLRTVMNSLIHPFNAFYDIKYLGFGSSLITLVIILVFYLLTVLKTLLGGFMYVIVEPDNFNALLIMGGTIGLVVLFAVTNWAVCSLFEGKGTLKDVFCVTGCALIPQLIDCVFYIIASHLVVPTGSSIINAVSTICILWSAIILIIGLLSLHDFTFTKTILTGLLTVVGIIVVIFVLFMIMTFFQNFVSFAFSLVREAVAR